VALIHRGLATLARRYKRFSAILYGTPLVLLKDGEWQAETMRHVRVQEMDVMAATRKKGVRTLHRHQVRHSGKARRDQYHQKVVPGAVDLIL
jgi:uncharacterized membrane protein YcaP (DUF421 family)